MGLFWWLGKWSLQLTGGAIIGFNYLHYQRQQRVIAGSSSLANALRTLSSILPLALKAQMAGNSQDTAELQQECLLKVVKLCQSNRGVYARLGQILSSMSGVLPEPLLENLRRLRTVQGTEASYEAVRACLTESVGEMKDVFDGFQTRPLSAGLFWQSHKCILLSNYRESLVKVMLPSTRYQADYDLWFLEWLLPRLQGLFPGLGKGLGPVLETAKQVLLEQLSFDKEYQNSLRLSWLMFESGSTLYIPYYYKKYCSSNVLIREFVEGVPLPDQKGLAAIGVSQPVATAHLMNEIQRIISKEGAVCLGLKESDLVVRKYVAPVGRAEGQGQGQAGAKKVLSPKVQVCLLRCNPLLGLPGSSSSQILAYWQQLRQRRQKGAVPSRASFNQFLKINALSRDQLLAARYFAYEPVLQLYSRVLGTH